MKQPPCDRDCFNCKFQDCIYDGMDYADYVEQAERDKILTETPETKKRAAQQRAYREANKEKVAAQRRAYYAANKEKVAAQRRAKPSSARPTHDRAEGGASCAQS